MPAPASSPPREPRAETALLLAWLLLLLDDGESYGRALLRTLGERGLNVESHRAYRVLRTLDHKGAVTSHWTVSDTGPQRRSYRLTRMGRGMLANLADSIRTSLSRQERFLEAYEHRRGRSPAGGKDAATAPGAAESGLSLGRELLAGWLLLLLLDADESYGYGLRRALDDHGVSADPGAMYRVLRRLEREGWVGSGWARSASGPRRRIYRLTEDGRSHLEELASNIAVARDGHAGFLHAYEHRSATDAARHGDA